LVARVYADAHGAGLVTLQLQARLAQLELLAPAERATASNRMLARELRDDAAKLGFGSIERRAAALRNQDTSARTRSSGDIANTND
jgi:hypothetical protein